MINKDNDFDLNIRWRFPGGRQYAFAFIALFVLLLVIYANSFQGAWVLDDEPNILENPYVHLENLNFGSLKQTFYDAKGPVGRPLAYLSFGINYYFGGTDVAGYHLVNFVIHYLTAIFLFLFIFKTLCLPRLKDTYEKHAYSIALIATVFWAVNPLQVTAVTYIVQRMASMAGLFYIMAMYFYVLGRTAPARGRQAGFFIAAALSALLSFASKENAAMLPVSVFIYDLLLIQGVNKASLRKNLAIALPLLAIPALLFFWKLDVSAILQGYDSRPFTLTERLLTQPRIIFFYICRLLYPLESNLALIHDFPVSTGLLSPVTTLLSISGIAGAIFFAFARSAKYPLLAFSILFFFVNHAIEGSFIALELVYEHRNYIPSFFFFVPIALLVIRALAYFTYNRLIQVGVALLMAAVWTGHGHTVYKRNVLFSDPLALWYDNVMKAPNLSRVYTNMGNALNARGAYGAAYWLFLQADALGRYHNKFGEGVNLYHLGNYHLTYGRQPEKAHAYFEKSADRYPGHWRPWQALALSKIALGRPAEAEKIALQLRNQLPDNADFRYILGLSYLRQGRFGDCREEARQALQRTMQPEAFYGLLGAASYHEGDFSGAAKCWEQALQTGTKNQVMLLALMDAYNRLGRHDARNRIVEKLLCMKQDRPWAEFIGEAAQDNQLSVYTVRPQVLLSVIGNSLKGMAP